MPKRPKKNDGRLIPCDGKKDDKRAVRDLHQFLFVILPTLSKLASIPPKVIRKRMGIEFKYVR